MKKIYKLFLIPVFVLICSVTLVACGNKPTTGQLANGTYRASGAFGQTVLTQSTAYLANFAAASEQLSFSEHFNHSILNGIEFSISGQSIPVSEYIDRIIDGNYLEQSITDHVNERQCVQQAAAEYLGHNDTNFDVFSDYQIRKLLYLYTRVIPYAETVFLVNGDQMTMTSRMYIPLNMLDFSLRELTANTFQYSVSDDNRLQMHFEQGVWKTAIAIENGKISWEILRAGFFVTWEIKN